jgi:hypothetical protein
MKKNNFISIYAHYLLANRSFKEWLFMSQNHSDFKSNFAGNREVTPEMQSIEERMKGMFEKPLF